LSFLSLLPVLGLALLPQGPAGPTGTYPALEPGRIRPDLAFLADDFLEGRDTGMPGEAVAARFLEARFRRLGLEALPGGFLRPFPAAPLELAPEPEVALYLEDEEVFVPPRDLVPHPSSPPGSVEAEVVVAGFGLSLPEYEYDDFELVDLEGRIALILRWEPEADRRDSRFAGRRLLPEALLRNKVRACQERGALAVLVADPPGLAERPDAPGILYWPNHSKAYRRMMALAASQLDPAELARSNFKVEEIGDHYFCPLQASAPLGSRIPVAYISQGVLEAVFRRAGKDLLGWMARLQRSGVSQSFASGVRASLDIAFREPRRSGRNVAGILRGPADDPLSREFVVVGAHYDHVGSNEDGAIWNGADDNASGTAALLALAESFVRSRTRPRRSLLFVAFSGEERGLLGSAWFLNDPELPVDRIVAMVNLDMVGRALAGRLQVLGTRSSPILPRLVRDASQGLGLSLDFEAEETFDRSDHASFYAQGIPVVFFSTGMHPDYHRPTDTWDKIDFDATSRVCILARRLIQSLATLDRRLPFEDGYHRQTPVYGIDPRLRVPFDVRYVDRLDY